MPVDSLQPEMQAQVTSTVLILTNLTTRLRGFYLPLFPPTNKQIAIWLCPAEETAWREQLQGKTHPQKMKNYVVEQEQLQKEILSKSLPKSAFYVNQQGSSSLDGSNELDKSANRGSTNGNNATATGNKSNTFRETSPTKRGIPQNVKIG